MSEEKQSGALEKPEDAGTGSEGEVKRWLLELDLADKNEKKWRDDANGALERYRNEKKKGNSFNILWANTEVTQPNVYSNKPRPDVRNRFPDKNPVAKVGAEVIERSLSFLMDDYDFDYNMDLCVFDMLLPGRAVSRVRFKPYMATQGEGDEAYETLASVDLQCEHVQWDDFRHGPGKTWGQVPWIAYRHKLTKTQVEEKFPKIAGEIKFDYISDGVEKDKADSDPDVFKRAIVWEIWDKDNREIVFIHPGYTKAPILKEADKLKLRDFFDCPRPLMSIFNSDTLIPGVEYEMYKEQAKELDKITGRINKLTDALKYRGVYDSAIDELKRLQSLEDGQLLPSSASGIAMQAGGLDKAIWTQPIEEIAKVLQGLYVQREQIKQTIYEIMGLADIMRGASDPNETLGAQELKAQTGSVRMKRRQKEVQRFIRDLLRIKAEILAEHVPAEILAMMTGMQIPTMEGKQREMITLQANPENEMAKKIADSPTWEEIIEMLRADTQRRFNIDIETDSTIAADQRADRENAVEVIEGIGGFVQNIGPAVQSGAISMEAAKKIMISIIRKAKLGREVEEAVEQDAMTPQQQKPDPEMAKAQAEMQTKQAELQLRGQEAQAKAQGDAEGRELKKQEMASNIQLKREEMQMNAQLKREQMAIDAELKREADQRKTMTVLETEKMRGEAASKPTTMVQVDSEGALQGVAETIQALAVQAATAGQQQNEILAQSLSQMAQSIGDLAQIMAAPKTIQAPSGKTYTAKVLN